MEDNAQRKLCDRAKRRRDAMTIASAYPTTEMQHRAVKRAMATLVLIDEHCKANGGEDPPYALRLEATTCIVGIIFFNSFAGRCGEWEEKGCGNSDNMGSSGECWFGGKW